MKKNDKRNLRDMRAYSRGTFIRLGIFGVLIILVVGNLLIRWIYGSEAVGLSISCMLVALIPGVLIAIFLAISSWVVRRARDDGTDPD